MVGESNQNVFLIQIDVSSFAEFEISESEISRVDCNAVGHYCMVSKSYNVDISAHRWV